VLSLTDSLIYKVIELIPLMLFCQKIIELWGEKISMHHAMPEALRPSTRGILVKESISRGKQRPLGKGLAKISIQSNILPQVWRVRQARKGACSQANLFDSAN
jgi:hypothetical protein